MGRNHILLSLTGAMENQEKEKIKYYICPWAKSFYMYECSKEFAQGFVNYCKLMGNSLTLYGKAVYGGADSYCLGSTCYVSPNWTQLKGYCPKIWILKSKTVTLFNDYVALMEVTLEYREIKD